MNRARRRIPWKDRPSRAPRAASLACAALATASGLLAVLAPAQADTTPALAPLAWLAGHWHCAGKFANGKPIASRETFTIELGGLWLRMRRADDPPNRYLVEAWWGYDKAAQHVTVTVFGNFGCNRRCASPGWVDDALTLANVATGGDLDRFAFQRLGDDAYRVTCTYRNRSGARQSGDAQTCTRDAPAPST